MGLLYLNVEEMKDLKFDQTTENFSSGVFGMSLNALKYVCNTMQMIQNYMLAEINAILTSIIALQKRLHFGKKIMNQSFPCISQTLKTIFNKIISYISVKR